MSATLRHIRQKYDNIHMTVLAKEKELKQKQRELEQAKNDENAIEERVEAKQSGLDRTREVLEGINGTHEYQLMV